MSCGTRTSLTPGSPRTCSAICAATAWSLRKRLPSELIHKTVLRWPADVATITGLAEGTLKKLRSEGDTPRMYALGRALYTTHVDLHEWIAAHELAAGQKLRPPTVARGTKRPPIRRVGA